MLGRYGYKIILGVTVVYILMGIIFFPSWYVSVLTYGGFEMLFHEMQTRYLLWNLGAIAIGFAFYFTIQHIENNHHSFFQNLLSIYRHQYTIILFWLLLITALTRILTTYFELQSAEKFQNISKLITEIQQNIEKTNLISNPIEVIYVNKQSLNNLYSQTQPELNLIESEKSNKNASSIEGGFNFKDLINLDGKDEQSDENKNKFKPRELSDAEKTTKIINYLSKDNKLATAKSLHIESKEWGKVEDSIRVFDAYGIEYNKQKIELVKKNLSDEALRSRASDTYSVNEWILLDGDIDVKTTTDSLNFNYPYVPLATGGVSFICDVPTSEMDKNELSILTKENKWNIRIFGKIIHVKPGPIKTYSMKCITIFR
ncbi:hypothetical protein HMPREF1170_01647 [Aeromonas veronii AMC35]|uniref:hypothetical protein n=2 Tax=Aeromonadaceae TaxID=84642 RepID=UPI000280771F|nr:hypothetical protein [Aeromonas veronii]EKB23286.1 hypothetical protein HMPREF1170_01647 [Aeromonas veronii AMC35]